MNHNRLCLGAISRPGNLNTLATLRQCNELSVCPRVTRSRRWPAAALLIRRTNIRCDQGALCKCITEFNGTCIAGLEKFRLALVAALLGPIATLGQDVDIKTINLWREPVYSSCHHRPAAPQYLVIRSWKEWVDYCNSSSDPTSAAVLKSKPEGLTDPLGNLVNQFLTSIITRFSLPMG